MLNKGGGSQYPGLAVCKQRLLDIGLAADVVEAVLPFVKVRLTLHRQPVHIARVTSAKVLASHSNAALILV